MTLSYRLIDTYSPDSGNLSGCWTGPRSAVAFTADGTPAYYGVNTFDVSSFNVGASFGSGATDVLNTTSGYGSDELNLSSLMSSTSNYSVSSAAVFNWGGNPANPGFGCDTFSLNTAAGVDGHLAYADTLASSDWGLVQDYEMSMDVSNYWDGNAAQISVSGFEFTNIRLTASMAIGTASVVTAANVGAGTFDLSQSYQANLTISTASYGAASATQTYAVLAGAHGDTVTVVNGTQTTDYAGTALFDNGAHSRLDFFDNGGGNTVNLTASQISSNLYLNGINGGLATHSAGALSFLASAPTLAAAESGILAGGGDLIELNASGTGAASIFSSDVFSGGTQLVTGFQLGRDSIDMIISAGTYSVSTALMSGTTGAVITGQNPGQGIVLAGVSAASVTSHMSTATVGGVEHLYIH